MNRPRVIEHFQTITQHRRYVRRECFALGLYFQGLTHDLSKFFPSEFLVGVRYYQGYRSPNNAEREEKGYSSAWLHHKGRNKHHYEYWTDYGPAKDGGGIIPVCMPRKYLAEMYADRVAASKTYKKDEYTDESPLQYYLLGKKYIIMHEETKRELEFLLTKLATEGEEATTAYIRSQVLHNQSQPFEFLLRKLMK